MKNFKKVLALTLAAVLLITGSVAATVAYLTLQDIDPKLNVFQVGDIKVSVTEEVGTEGVATVTPTTDNEGNITGATYSDVMPGDKLTKKVTVKNEGDHPVYVALSVKLNNAGLLNEAIDETYENAPYNYDAEQIQAIYDKVFPGWGIRYDKYADDGTTHLGMRLTNQLETDSTLLRVDSAKTTTETGNFLYSYTNWFQTQLEMDNFTAGIYGSKPRTEGYYTANMNDYELLYTYYLYLEPGETFTPFTGLNVPVEFSREQLAMFSGLNISVNASAIQADNMEGTAQDAFKILAEELEKADP